MFVLDTRRAPWLPIHFLLCDLTLVYLPELIHLLVSHEPRWPSSCPFSWPTSLPPQGLCTCSHGNSISSFRPQFKYHLLREAFLTTLFRGNRGMKRLSIMANNYTAGLWVRFLNFVILLCACIPNLS